MHLSGFFSHSKQTQNEKNMGLELKSGLK
jgi:hypothetical protein